MHDRGDYKSGWELERDWEQQQKEKKLREEGKLAKEAGEQEEDEDEEKYPFACYVCREALRDPVKTKCGHFFCERCALKKCKVECQVCGAKTGSSFSMPTKVERKKLDEAKAKHEAKKKEGDEEEEDGEGEANE